MSSPHPEYLGVYCPTCEQDCLPVRGKCMWCDTYVLRWLYGTYKTANAACITASRARKKGLRAKAEGREVWVDGEREVIAA